MRLNWFVAYVSVVIGCMMNGSWRVAVVGRGRAIDIVLLPSSVQVECRDKMRVKTDNRQTICTDPEAVVIEMQECGA